MMGLAGGVRWWGKKRARNGFRLVAETLDLSVSGSVATGAVDGFDCRLETGMKGDAAFLSFKLKHRDFEGLRGGPTSLWAVRIPLGDETFDKVVAFESFPPRLRSRLDGTGRHLLVEAVRADVTINEGAVVWRTERPLNKDEVEAQLETILALAKHLRPVEPVDDLLAIANSDADEPVAVGAIDAVVETARGRSAEAAKSRWPRVRLFAWIGARDVDGVASVADDLSQPEALRLQGLAWLVDHAPERTQALWKLVEQGISDPRCIELVERLAPRLTDPQAKLLATHDSPRARWLLATLLESSTLALTEQHAYLRELLADREDEVVSTAAEALARTGTVADIPALQAAASRVFLSAATKRAIAVAIERIQSGVDPSQAGGLAVADAGGLAVAQNGEVSVADNE